MVKHKNSPEVDAELDRIMAHVTGQEPVIDLDDQAVAEVYVPTYTPAEQAHIERLAAHAQAELDREAKLRADAKAKAAAALDAFEKWRD